MRGLLTHFKLTLLLNLRSKQALVYGYLVPIFFLIAFASIFRSSPPLIRQLGQLLTISVMGGACFGMPTAMVAERERGIWRRYRLLPASTGSLMVSIMGARFLIVLSAALMQVVLARLMYGMPLPAHPVQMLAAFAVVTFAFLGMGLIIAMLSGSVPAVQALGQAIFLPMIMIGGVGVPLWALPEWAQRLAGYLPGKYAVEALQACASGGGLGVAGFDLAALVVIGISACVAGGMMFRWDAHEKVAPGRWGWIVLALAGWVAVGVAAEAMHRPRILAGMDAAGGRSLDSGYVSITAAQIEGIKYGELTDDEDRVVPLAANLAGLNEEGRARIAEFRKQLAAWVPGKEGDVVRRVRNLLDAAGVADLAQDRYEAVIAFVILEKVRGEVPEADLKQALAWIVLHPNDEKPVVGIAELGIETTANAADVNERAAMYAAKLLGKMLGKWPVTQP